MPIELPEIFNGDRFGVLIREEDIDGPGERSGRIECRDSIDPRGAVARDGKVGDVVPGTTIPGVEFFSGLVEATGIAKPGDTVSEIRRIRGALDG